MAEAFAFDLYIKCSRLGEMIWQVDVIDLAMDRGDKGLTSLPEAAWSGLSDCSLVDVDDRSPDECDGYIDEVGFRVSDCFIRCAIALE
jgi:hypothetical protein